MMKKKINELFLKIAFVAVILWASGCALNRNPVPIEKMPQAKISGMPDIRCWEFDYKPDLDKNSVSSDCNFLALSGGGANGAFGAGFLCGWSAAGTRPDFRIVTGISTGALIAPIAFAGSEYDKRLRAYTTIQTNDILKVRGIYGIMPLLIGESYADTEPLVKLISQTVNDEVIKAVAKEYAKGRRLYIGTTDLDAQRLVIWDMGAIAASGKPDAFNLFRKVMLASASIPGAFPPVYFNVETDGKKYDEMHVDGGVMTEVFGFGTTPFKDNAAAEKLLAGT